MARPSVAARGHLGRFGRQLRGLLGARHRRRALSLRFAVCGSRAGPAAAARVHASRLARLRPGADARTAVRLPGERPVGARQRPSLQPVQDPVRSLRARGGAPHALARVADRPRRQQPAGPRHPGQCAMGAAGGGDRRRLRLGRRSPAGDAAAGHGPVRAARARLHAAPSRRPREPARLVPGSRLRAGDRAPEVARGDRGRAPARPRPRRRAAPGRSRADQLLGLQHARVLRPRVALRLRVPAARGGARVQDDGPGAARGRARGDPRRRLQPHWRRQPSRAHSTTRSTTGSCRGRRGTTRISPAAATR